MIIANENVLGQRWLDGKPASAFLVVLTHTAMRHYHWRLQAAFVLHMSNVMWTTKQKNSCRE